LKGKIEVFGEELEYDFIAGWIKYNRLQRGYSQEALSYGICSTSHLSYFENGKKKLNADIIEAILEKLNIKDISNVVNIGNIRQNLYHMMSQIESFNPNGARTIYEQLQEADYIIAFSPYNIEYKIYQLVYHTIIDQKDYGELKNDIEVLDKIYTSLNKHLQYLFLLASGRVFYKYKSHKEGLSRLLKAYDIKETPLINYYLGFSYCFDNQHFRGTYYLEKALNAYEKSGQYISALWCHNYLGVCYTEMNMFTEAEMHFKATLTGAKHYNIDNLFCHLYVSLSHLYLCNRDYEQCISWVEEALKTKGDPILPACNYVEAYFMLNDIEKCKEILSLYLRDEYSQSLYYPLLKFHYLSMFHLEEEIFFKTVTEEILPYYEKINYYNVCKPIKLKLVEHFEKNKKYKAANEIYKELFL